MSNVTYPFPAAVLPSCALPASALPASALPASALPASVLSTFTQDTTQDTQWVHGTAVSLTSADDNSMTTGAVSGAAVRTTVVPTGVDAAARKGRGAAIAELPKPGAPPRGEPR